MKQLVLAVCLAATLPVAGRAVAADSSFSISADQWALPRSGAALIKLAPLHAALQAWIAAPDEHIVILHAGSDVGNLWAGELADWLVALGVPSDHIEKRVSGDQPEDSITLKVQD